MEENGRTLRDHVSHVTQLHSSIFNLAKRSQLPRRGSDSVAVQPFLFLAYCLDIWTRKRRKRHEERVSSRVWEKDCEREGKHRQRTWTTGRGGIVRISRKGREFSRRKGGVRISGNERREERERERERERESNDHVPLRRDVYPLSHL